MTDEEEEGGEFSDEDRRAVEASRQYFGQGGEGLLFEQVVAECGFTMDQILADSSKGE